MTGEIDDHRAFEIVLFLLLAGPRSRRPQHGHLFTFLTSCGVFLPIHALQVHIESFLAQREGEHQRLAVSNTFYCHARPWRGPTYMTAYEGQRKRSRKKRARRGRGRRDGVGKRGES